MVKTDLVADADHGDGHGEGRRVGEGVDGRVQVRDGLPSDLTAGQSSFTENYRPLVNHR